MSTSESLPALVEQGRFRPELYHRVSIISLTLPPLRHRGTDIELLAESFRARYAQESRKAVTGFSREALDILQRHDWPGNVRELEAAVRRAVALCTGPRITPSLLAPIIDHHRLARAPRAGAPPPQGDPLPEAGPGGAREADHHPGAPGLQLEPPGDRPGARHQPHYALQKDE